MTSRAGIRTSILIRLALVLGAGVSVALSGPVVAAQASAGWHFRLDHVKLQVESRLLRGLSFAVAPNGSAMLTATGASTRSGRLVSVTAVPFGTQGSELFSPGAKGDPVARKGGAARELRALRAELRRDHAVIAKSRPVASLFGKRVRGLLASEPGFGQPRRLVVAEWVVEAGPRLWVVEVTDGLSAGSAPTRELRALRVTIRGSGLRARTSSRPSRAPVNQIHYGQGGGGPGSAPWWNGDCDANS